VWVISSPETALTPTRIALGNFDGVHRGHQQVIQTAAADLPHEASSEPGSQGLGRLTVVAFDPHPQEFFSGEKRTLLTPLREKIQQLQQLGVEQLALLPFTDQLACLRPEEFVEQILVKQLQATAISVGFNFGFGYQRSGTATDLQAIAGNWGVPVQIVAAQTFDGDRISSSAIRQDLLEGKLSRANCLLGRAYTLMGEVVLGQQLGQTLGFPTANLQLPPEKFLPCPGVYAVLVESSALETRQLGVMNLGYRPTVGGTQQTAEVHLLDWSGDLYGQSLTVHLQEFLRSEQRFASLDDLKAQIQQDCKSARHALEATS
jgi:riboflavin kinase / FMN adenylyltransferase